MGMETETHTNTTQGCTSTCPGPALYALLPAPALGLRLAPLKAAFPCLLPPPAFIAGTEGPRLWLACLRIPLWLPRSSCPTTKCTCT